MIHDSGLRDEFHNCEGLPHLDTTVEYPSRQDQSASEGRASVYSGLWLGREQIDAPRSLGILQVVAPGEEKIKRKFDR
jgi:hypothetical protein